MLVEQTQKLKRRLRDGFAHSRPRHVLNTLANEFDRKGQRISLLSHPRILQVEVTNRCNLNCLFCSRYCKRKVPVGIVASDSSPPQAKRHLVFRGRRTKTE